MSIQDVAEQSVPFTPVAVHAVSENLCKISVRRCGVADPKVLTSLSFAFKNGFLMYHVEVKNVSAKTTNSSLPETFMASGLFLCDVLAHREPISREIDVLTEQ